MAMAGILSVDYNITYDVGKDRLRKFVQICDSTVDLLENNI